MTESYTTVTIRTAPRELTVGDTTLGDIADLCPKVLAERLLAIPEECFTTTRADMENKAGMSKGTNKNAQIMRRLRYNFWAEWRNALDPSTPDSKMSVARICNGEVTTHSFMRTYTTQPYKMAYILLPPESHKVRLEEAAAYALDECRKAADIPLTRKVVKVAKDGSRSTSEEVDITTLNFKFNFMKWVYDRLEGTSVSRSMNISKNFNENTSKRGHVDLTQLENMSEKELDRLLGTIESSNIGTEEALAAIKEARDVTS